MLSKNSPSNFKHQNNCPFPPLPLYIDINWLSPLPNQNNLFGKPYSLEYYDSNGVMILWLTCLGYLYLLDHLISIETVLLIVNLEILMEEVMPFAPSQDGIDRSVSNVTPPIVGSVIVRIQQMGSRWLQP